MSFKTNKNRSNAISRIHWKKSLNHRVPIRF